MGQSSRLTNLKLLAKYMLTKRKLPPKKNASVPNTIEMKRNRNTGTWRRSNGQDDFWFRVENAIRLLHMALDSNASARPAGLLRRIRELCIHANQETKLRRGLSRRQTA